MQGHSHVRMGTTPSGVDTSHQKDIIEQLRGNMFYIFMIWNKRLENTTIVYDMKRNTVYDGKDVKISISERGGLDINTFYVESKKMVANSTYTYSSTVKSSTSTPASTVNASVNKPSVAYEIVPAHSAAASSVKTGKTDAKEDKKKNKRRANTTTKIGSGWRGKGADSESDWDDWERYLQQH